jgi:hypothetical protein
LRPEEREHAFLLAFGGGGVLHEELSPVARERLQKLVDRLDPWPAFIKSPSWDVLLWNTAATRVLSDYPSQPPEQRNVLRTLFLDPDSPRRIKDWHTEAALAVATFRAELVRWGVELTPATALIAELIEASEAFREMWKSNEVGRLGEGEKTFLLPDGECVTMRYESLAVDAFPGLGLVVYTPVDHHRS